MKLSSVSFLLILLPCAFLINRVSGGEKLTSEKTSSQAKQANNPDAKEAASNNPTPPTEFKSRSAVNEPASNREKADSKKSTSETGYYDFFWATEMPIGISILGWFIAALVAWWSLGAVYRQADIADEGVKVAHAAVAAAKESAEIANKALHTDRPYLLIEDIKLTGINAPSKLGIVAAWIVVANYGKGPAFIDETIGAIRIVNGELPARDYSGCTELGVQNVIRPGESLPDSLMATLKVFSDTDREQFLAGDDRKNLVVYGRIAYRDLMDGQYTEGFYWQADAFSTRIRISINSLAEPKMRRGPKTHNYHE